MAFRSAGPTNTTFHNMVAERLDGDAFGRLRVSNTATLFESSFTYDKQPLLFEEITTAGGSAIQTGSALRLAVDGTPGAVAAVQSRAYTPYEKGKSQLIKMTGVLGAPTAGVRVRVGYFDTSDGFYIQQSGDGLAVVRRSLTTGTPTETVVPQADWNIDPMDGTGKSHIEIDPTKAQILAIDGQWLGVGRVRLAWNIDGVNYYFHEFLHANREPVAPYTRSFTLPLRYEIATTDGGAGELKAVCCDVESEGGVDAPSGFVFSAANTVNVATSTTPVAVLSIRPTKFFPAAGRFNRSFIIPGDVSVLIGSATCLIEIQYDAVLDGGTWTRADPNSAMEVGVGQTITTPGIKVASLFAPEGAGNLQSVAGRPLVSQYPLVTDSLGENPKGLTVVATTVTGSGTARASMGWSELR